MPLFTNNQSMRPARVGQAYQYDVQSGTVFGRHFTQLPRRPQPQKSTSFKLRVLRVSIAVLVVFVIFAIAEALVLTLGNSEEAAEEESAWNTWSQWGSCSATCGTGMRNRNRQCYQGDSSTTSDKCVGFASEIGSCNEINCPTWSEWNAYSSCSSTCGSGTQARSRTCNDPDFTRARCERGDPIQSRDCNIGECPLWSTWSAYDVCSTTCGPGTQQRTRMCQDHDSTGGTCVGENSDLQECNLGLCPFWDMWSEFGYCSSTCGPGMQQRVRDCQDPDLTGGICLGDSTNTQECDNGACSLPPPPGEEQVVEGALTLEQEFTDALLDPSTEEYQTLKADIQLAVGGVLKMELGVNFHSFEVTGFRPGSVIAQTMTVTSNVPDPAAAVAGTIATAAAANELGPLMVSNVGSAMVAFTSATATVAEGDSQVTLSLTNSGGAAGTITLSTNDGTATGGTDFIARSSVPLTIAASTTESFTVDITDDAIPEMPEAFTVTFTGAMGTTTATVTITDNDASVDFVSTSVMAVEGDGTVTLTLTNSGGAQATISLSTQDGSGDGGAGTDYTALSSVPLTIAAYDTVTFTVVILDDDIAESPDTFTVTFTGHTGIITTATVTVIDDDTELSAG